MHDELLSIGQISKIVDISTDTLRYYDEIGLLKPELIDQSTRYRYYTKSQLDRLTRILELKQDGFSLDTIGLILSQQENTELLKSLYKTKLHEMKQEQTAIEKKIEKLTRKIQFEEGSIMSKTAIIVEDVPFMSNTIRDIMERNGYAIDAQIYNGIEAVEAYKKYKSDLVVMDITMPEMDGIGALIEIKKLDAKAKVAMCTAYWQPKMILDCMRFGACGYVLKPFFPETLVALLNEAVENNNSLDEQALKMLSEDKGLCALTERNVIISQDLVQNIVNACLGGDRGFLEKL